MSASFHGTLFDGETLTPHPVALVAEAGRLRSQTDGIMLDVPLPDVRTSDRLASLPRFLYLPDGRTVETPDNETVDAWLAGQRRGREAALVHWLETRSRVVAAATLLLVTTVAALVWWGLPILAQQAALAVPASIERQAGQSAIITLNRLLAPSNLTAEKRARVTRQLDRLVKAGALPAQPEIVFRSMGGKFPNAFALPGGFIVVSDELVALATDEELAAVLAHEIGHWQLRHGLQGVLRSSAALLVVSTVTGDLSTLTTFAGTIPFTLLQRGYSREFEEAADEYAVALLGRAHIHPAHFASILKKLEDARPAKGQDFTYLSTHPATADRIRRINPGGQPPPKSSPTPVVTVQDGNVTYETSALAPNLPSEVAWEGSRHFLVPIALEQPSATYPPEMLAAGSQGEVEVEFEVDDSGKVRRPVVKRSSDHGFDAAAVAAVEKWTYSPARYRNQYISSHVTAKINFGLGDPFSPAGEPAESPADAPMELGPGDIRPRSLSQVQPKYPSIMSNQSLEGEVVVEFVISRHGDVRYPRVIRSTYKEFEEPALEAIRQWKFTPAERDGRKIPVRVSQLIQFDLKDAPK